MLFVWSARAVSAPAATKSVFTFLAWLEFALAVGYAVNWGTAEGGEVQDSNQEVRKSVTAQGVVVWGNALPRLSVLAHQRHDISPHVVAPLLQLIPLAGHHLHRAGHRVPRRVRLCAHVRAPRHW